MIAGEIWVGMSLEQLLAVKGQPNRKTHEHLRTIFEFGGIQRRFVVTVEELKVAKIE